MKRVLIFLYGLVCYAIALVTLLYAIGFVGNLWVPKSIDSARDVPLGLAVLQDVVLLLVFALQHSVMARPAFKRWWTRIIPKAAERSTYILFASIALIVLYRFWEPLGGVVWSVQLPMGQAVLYVVYALGWGLVFLSSFLINHFDLFGLRQVWLQLLRRPYRAVDFGTPWLYRYVRHPLYLGLLLAFWSAPTMTLTHLVFAIATTLYILIAIQLEEYDLEAAHSEYAQYRRRVPMLVPFLGGGGGGAGREKRGKVSGAA
jgi:protein-S-isoprenylcysteine O-methyltransferase Ste14